MWMPLCMQHPDIGSDQVHSLVAKALPDGSDPTLSNTMCQATLRAQSDPDLPHPSSPSTDMPGTGTSHRCSIRLVSSEIGGHVNNMDHQSDQVYSNRFGSCEFEGQVDDFSSLFPSPAWPFLRRGNDHCHEGVCSVCNYVRMGAVCQVAST